MHDPATIAKGDVFRSHAGNWAYRVLDTSEEGWVYYTVVGSDGEVRGKRGKASVGDFHQRIGRQLEWGDAKASRR